MACSTGLSKIYGKTGTTANPVNVGPHVRTEGAFDREKKCFVRATIVCIVNAGSALTNETSDPTHKSEKTTKGVRAATAQPRRRTCRRNSHAGYALKHRTFDSNQTNACRFREIYCLDWRGTASVGLVCLVGDVPEWVEGVS